MCVFENECLAMILRADTKKATLGAKSVSIVVKEGLVQ